MNGARVHMARLAGPGEWGTPPFGPAESFPELAGTARGDNELYAHVRRLLAAMGLDAGRCGAPGWNPLGALVGAGGTIVLKPNLVRHRHGSGGPLASVVTDPRLIRAILDYAVLAVAPGGRVIVADSPLQSCDFAALRERLGLDALARAGERDGVRVAILDYRREEVAKGPDGLILRRTPLPGDPDGYAAVDLGGESALAPLVTSARRFRVTQYDRRIMARHHDGARHEYLIPRSLLTAGLVISIPKIKTHRKAGMTGALKNLVGVNGAKSWLPHHRSGSLAEGGDEYLHPSLRKRLMTRIWERMDRTPSLTSRRWLERLQRWIRDSGRLVPFPDPYFEGSWYGNTTLPAMVADLNRIFMYADAGGSVHARPQRRVLVFADMLLAGEGEGPLEPTPRPLGVILAGANPVAVDWAAAALMGFDPGSIPTLTAALAPHARPLVDFDMASLGVEEVAPSGESRALPLASVAEDLGARFVPPSGWAGRIEARRRAG